MIANKIINTENEKEKLKDLDCFSYFYFNLIFSLHNIDKFHGWFEKKYIK